MYVPNTAVYVPNTAVYVLNEAFSLVLESEDVDCPLGKTVHASLLRSHAPLLCTAEISAVGNRSGHGTWRLIRPVCVGADHLHWLSQYRQGAAATLDVC